MHRSTIALAAIFSLSLLLGLLGDSQASPEARDQKVRAVDVTGSYDSNYGPVHLEQSGDRVVGNYECCGGGRIEGYLRDGIIDYKWYQPNASGSGRWKVVNGGDKLVGEWGLGKSRTSGGSWDLTRRAQIASGSVARVR